MAKFYRKKLKNKMTVILEQRKGSGVVSVAFATRYGSINEGINEKGIAHFIEHLLYKGTPKRNSLQISTEIEKRGGVLNGFTSEQITAYWCKMPSKHLNVALEVISDMVKNPIFDEKEIEKERKVIFEEMKMYTDNPQMHVHEKIISCLYKGTMGMRIIGSEKTLGRTSKEKMVKKFEQVYSTDNLILCVVGDANFKDLCKFVEENFPPKKGFLPKQKIILSKQQQVETRRGIDQASLILAYHVPTASSKKHYPAQVLSTLMAGGMSSRLFSEIREKRNLAYAVKGGCDIDKDFGFNTIYVGTIKKNVPLVKKIILEEFKKLSVLKKKELEEVKEQIIGNHKISREDSQGQMLELLYGEISGNPKSTYEYERKIRSVKLKDVTKLAQNAIKNYSFFALVPA